MDDKLQDDINKRMEENYNEALKSTYTSAVAGQVAQPLTIESLMENMNKAKRDCKFIYIMASECLPDDCYGILMVRPEDAKGWRKTK